jgi:antitoxin ParD1/3/4
MSEYALTPLAKADIFDIWSYIAEDSQAAADRVEQATYACAFLTDGPLRGHSRPDLTTRPVRFWTLTRYPNYTIVYRPRSRKRLSWKAAGAESPLPKRLATLNMPSTDIYARCSS